MRTQHKAKEAVETFSPAEEQFNRRRRTVGLILAPTVLIGLLLAPIPIADGAHKMAAIIAMMMVLWVTEALPLSATALLGPVMAVILRVAPVRTALAPFADPTVFLFIGAFMLAEGMFVHRLDRRIAYTALSWRLVGTSAGRVLVVYGAVATVLSMWISNTATTAMLFPIGMSLIGQMSHSSGRINPRQGFAMAMMLITAFGASIGGMATPVGTPPNLIGIGMLERIGGTRIGFFDWMALAVPVVLIMFVAMCAVLYLMGARGTPMHQGGTEAVRAELKKLGQLSAGERNVLIAFGTTIVLWVAPGLFAVSGLDDTAFARAYTQAMPEGVAAICGALLLFLLPTDWRARRFTLTWDEASNIDWGIVLLFGGGLAVGELAFSTGLAEAMGKGITAWLPSQSTAAITILFTATAIILSEATSNTAAANMIVPVAIAVAQAAGIRPLEPALGATLGASMGFMMPVSSPTNAIVYSSGYISITSMMRFGVILDILGFVVISVVVLLLGPLLF
ncbi:MAG: DASS family sodium-coupled anion symporter [Vicinamibacterales bacterium]